MIKMIRSNDNMVTSTLLEIVTISLWIIPIFISLEKIN